MIIDPLYYIVCEENDNMLMTAVIREFAKLRKALGISIVVIHHTDKSIVDWTDPFLAGRGASSIGGAFEFVLALLHKSAVVNILGHL